MKRHDISNQETIRRLKEYIEKLEKKKIWLLRITLNYYLCFGIVLWIIV